MTMLFLNSSPKISKLFIFGPKFTHFCFFHEIVQIYKFEGAEFKYSNSFFTILSQKCPNKALFVKNTQKSHFGSEIQAFLFFHEVLQRDKFDSSDFKYDTSVFKVLSQKYPNKTFLFKYTQIKHFCSQIQVILFFRQILQLDKFEGADFKYDSIVFKLQSKNTQIRHLRSKFRHFHFFREIWQTNKFESADFKYHKKCFTILPQKGQNKGFLVKKNPNEAFLVPYLGFLFFAPNFAIRQFRGD